MGQVFMGTVWRGVNKVANIVRHAALPELGIENTFDEFDESGQAGAIEARAGDRSGVIRAGDVQNETMEDALSLDSDTSVRSQIILKLIAKELSHEFGETRINASTRIVATRAGPSFSEARADELADTRASGPGTFVGTVLGPQSSVGMTGGSGLCKGI
jgi:hypothetical protein